MIENTEERNEEKRLEVHVYVVVCVGGKTMKALERRTGKGKTDKKKTSYKCTFSWEENIRDKT